MELYIHNGNKTMTIPMVKSDSAGINVVLHPDSREMGKNAPFQYPHKRTAKYLPCWDGPSRTFINYYILPYYEINRVCEINGGNSSIWLAKHVPQVVTVEYESSEWREAIKRWAKKEGLNNIDVLETIESVEGSFDLSLLDARSGADLDNIKKVDGCTTKIIAIDGFHAPPKKPILHKYLMDRGWIVFYQTPQMWFFGKGGLNVNLIGKTSDGL